MTRTIAEQYSELAESLGCDQMDSHQGRLSRARRLASLSAHMTRAQLSFYVWCASLAPEERYDFDSEGRGFKKPTRHMMQLAWEASALSERDRIGHELDSLHAEISKLCKIKKSVDQNELSVVLIKLRSLRSLFEDGSHETQGMANTVRQEALKVIVKAIEHLELMDKHD